MKKRLIVCCDGTWQDLETRHPTNIVKLLQAILPEGVISGEPAPQIAYYDSGVGTRDLANRLAGGAFGLGLDTDVAEAYRFLVLNWEPGDEIYLFGYSRGAYTVRSLAGLIYNCGLIKRPFIRQTDAAIGLYRDREKRPKADESRNFRRSFSRDARITAIGCFDTVGSLGIPDLVRFLPFDNWANARYSFHDQELSPIVDHAFHAIGIDERRKVFAATPMEAHPSPTQPTRSKVVCRRPWVHRRRLHRESSPFEHHPDLDGGLRRVTRPLS